MYGERNELRDMAVSDSLNSVASLSCPIAAYAKSTWPPVLNKDRANL